MSSTENKNELWFNNYAFYKYIVKKYFSLNQWKILKLHPFM